MDSIHYISVVDAGDVLYETGDKKHHPICLAVAQHVTAAYPRRSFIHHQETISYWMDLSNVFVVSSEELTDIRFIYALLKRVKTEYHSPDRPLHFEHTLDAIFKEFNSLNLEKAEDPKVAAVKTAMETVPPVQKETIHSLLSGGDIEELEPDSQPFTSVSLQLDLDNEHNSSSNLFPKKSRYLLFLMLPIVGLASLAVVIFWLHPSQRSPTPPSTPTRPPN